jgi:hypothetical protein
MAKSDAPVEIDFSHPEAQRMLNAMADALVPVLAVQQARDDHARWLATITPPAPDPDKP